MPAVPVQENRHPGLGPPGDAQLHPRGRADQESGWVHASADEGAEDGVPRQLRVGRLVLADLREGGDAADRLPWQQLPIRERARECQ
eukprot:COSAG01_NODE_8591_length_2725_cov_55.670602_5_plen_87_part_00